MRIAALRSSLLAAAVLLAACNGDTDMNESSSNDSPSASTGTASSGPDPDQLKGRVWRFETVADETLPTGAEVDLSFDFERQGVAGLAACNRYTAGFKLEGTTLEVQTPAATKRACPEPLMTVEQRFLDTLRNARSLAMESGVLVLTDADGRQSTARAAGGD